MSFLNTSSEPTLSLKNLLLSSSFFFFFSSAFPEKFVTGAAAVFYCNNWLEMPWNADFTAIKGNKCETVPRK